MAYFRKHHPANVLMPLRPREKCPCFKHKGGAWSWEQAEEFMEAGSLRDEQPVGILMRDLIAIDLDDPTLQGPWEAGWPELQQCAKERTSHGAHYLMARTALCDELGLFDGAGNLRDNPKVDLKTVTSTGTAGVLCVAPSPGKTWVREPQGPLQPISEGLVRYLASLRPRPVDQRPEAPRKRARVAGCPSTRLLYGNRPADAMAANDIYRLVSLLAPARWDTYDSWVKIGIAMRREDPDNELGYREVYQALSERSPHWTPAAERKWHELPEDGRVGLGTVHMWARQDNPTGYAAYTRRTVRGALAELCSLGRDGQFRAARAILGLRPGQFVNTENAGRAFYGFWDHRWHQGGDSRISEAISEDLGDLLKERLEAVRRETEEAVSTGSREERQEAAKRLNKATLLHSATSNSQWKEGVFKQLQYAAYTGVGFLQQLDADPNLLGCDNGVLNLDTGEFAPGKPEDMVSRTVGYPFTPMVDVEARAAIRAFVSSCFETERDEAFLYQTLASCLSGSNSQEAFVMWLGKGSNGKSAMATLMGATLNEGPEGYAGTVCTSFLTNATKSSQAATPELAALQGRRFVTSMEPEKDQQLQGGKVKKLSGRDPITARQLYGQQLTWTPQFTIFLQANLLPKLTRADDATRRRIHVQEWNRQFVDEPVAPNERPIDRSLKDGLCRSLVWRQQFLLLLLEHRVKPPGRIVPPPSVVRASQRYHLDCNPLGEWVEECLEFGAYEVPLAEWRNSYQGWALTNGVPALGPRAAAKALTEGWPDSISTRLSHGVTIYRGFRIAQQPDEGGAL